MYNEYIDRYDYMNKMQTFNTYGTRAKSNCSIHVFVNLQMQSMETFSWLFPIVLQTGSMALL